MPDRVNPELHTYAVNITFTGDPADFTTSDDSFRMGSQAATHLDALAHVGYEGLLWNDTRRLGRDSPRRSRLGIEHVGAIATRACCSTSRGSTASTTSTTTTRSPATTSRPRRPRPASSWSPATRCSCAPARCTSCARATSGATRCRRPGLSTQSIEWIRDHDVALVATDTLTFEVYPCEDPQVFMPVHMIHLRDMGLAQGQNWHLDDLAADCAADAQYDFLLVATPLPLTGAVGARPRRPRSKFPARHHSERGRRDRRGGIVVR